MGSQVRMCALLGLSALVGCGGQAVRQGPATTTHSASADALTSDNGPSLNGISVNGISVNGISVNGISVNGISVNGISVNGISVNGISVNGISVNGISVNGISVNGDTIGGIDFAGATKSGQAISDVSLDTTQLTGVLPDGSTLAGADWTGAELNASVSNGASLKVKITKVIPWSDAVANGEGGPVSNGISVNGISVNGISVNGISVNGRGEGRGHGHTIDSPDAGTPSFPTGTPEMMAYDVVVETQGGEIPLCGVDASGNAVPAIPLAGRWNYASRTVGGGSHIDDPSQFTFGCFGAALAKCVELGYWPWTGADGANHHQACTRMIRADYCGDGTPHTVDGMLVNLYDNEGIQTDSENWPFEAEWDADGATCVAHQRVFDTTQVHCFTPHSFGPRNTCGELSHFESGTLIMDEYSPSDQIR